MAATAPSGGLGGRGGGSGGRREGGGCGLSAPSGFLGGGFFEGSGGSHGKGAGEPRLGGRLAAEALLSAQPLSHQEPAPRLTLGPWQESLASRRQLRASSRTLSLVTAQQPLLSVLRTSQPVSKPGRHSESLSPALSIKSFLLGLLSFSGQTPHSRGIYSPAFLIH